MSRSEALLERVGEPAFKKRITFRVSTRGSSSFKLGTSASRIAFSVALQTCLFDTFCNVECLYTILNRILIFSRPYLT